VAEGEHGEEKEGKDVISFQGSIGGEKCKFNILEEVTAIIASANAPVVPVAMSAKKSQPTPTAYIFLGEIFMNVKEKTKNSSNKYRQ
jgi:hypothetical protein